MALAEELESPENTKNTGPLGRDDFVKRRQEARAAAGDGRTDAPGDGDETSLLNVAGEAAEGAETDDQAKAATEGQPEGGPEKEQPKSDIDFFAFDDDEVGEEAEPAKLPVLEPPASMTAAEKAAFAEWPDEAKQFAARMHEAQARTARESGETTAARNKEIEDRVAELDRSLVEAKAVLDQSIDDIPFTPPHSEADLDRLLEESDDDKAYSRALRENAKAQSEHKAAIQELKAEREKRQAEIDEQIKARRQQIIGKFNEELPKLIPSWAKPDIRKKEGRELGSYLLSTGFSEGEVKQVIDARLVTLARKAMRYDAALAKKRESRGRAANGSATARPGPTGARPSKQSSNADLEAADKRYRENPSADNFAKLRSLRRAAAEASNTRRRV